MTSPMRRLFVLLIAATLILDGGTTTFAYDAAGRLSTEQKPPPTGIVATYQYDAADRLIQSVENNPPPANTPLASITITRDALGRPTNIARRQPLMPGATSPATTSFTYAAASQISGLHGTCRSPLKSPLTLRLAGMMHEGHLST